MKKPMQSLLALAILVMLSLAITGCPKKSGMMKTMQNDHSVNSEQMMMKS